MIYAPYGSNLAINTDCAIVNQNISILESYQKYEVYESVNLPPKVKDITPANNGDVEMTTDKGRKKLMIDKLNLEIVKPLIVASALDMKFEFTRHNSKLEFFQDRVDSCVIDIMCSSSSFTNYFARISNSNHSKQIITSSRRIRPSKQNYPGRLLHDKSTLLDTNVKYQNLEGLELFETRETEKLMSNGSNGFSKIQVPDFKRLINDCGKMGVLDSLLKRLHSEKHRCLIFCQMTKMMDIIEEYLSWMQYTYFRMDGSTQINDRRDMVDEFQKNDKIF